MPPHTTCRRQIMSVISSRSAGRRLLVAKHHKGLNVQWGPLDILDASRTLKHYPTIQHKLTYQHSSMSSVPTALSFTVPYNLLQHFLARLFVISPLCLMQPGI
ncbi:uncharacterized protein MCYG_08468 [Microsporum canis CBS 113480]|uniref:Uncharacterized protein n=1 Tax=Arthroderma otae (strain ATCC MYA-4605 / CBS 113480) TaxID=554155 RepID=C5G0J6_ARTOC|nr:uncharacterized protein MCYG_08468 [Microsporum canis CBS 113480]EEQ35649.1 predicted protein [Microsporum canis CBS 113480]